MTILVLVFSWQIFNLVTQFVYQYYATDQNLYFMQGRDFMTGFIPVFSHGSNDCFQKLLLKKKSPQCGFGEHSDVCGNLLYLHMETLLVSAYWKYLFYGSDLICPGTVDGSPGDWNRGRKSNGVFGGKGSWRNYGYVYGIIAMIILGLIYYFWFIQQNRINLLPFYTVFDEIQVSALRVQATTTTILNTLVQTFG